MSDSRPMSRESGALGCAGRKRGGELCGQPAIRGTDLCRLHSGKSVAKARAQGQVVVELQSWGLTDELEDPGTVLLRLVSQSSARVELYSSLLERAYRAAEGARQSREADPNGISGADARLIRGDPDSGPENRLEQVDDILAQGGVSALIGHKRAATDRGEIYNTEEALRALVVLEADERDRCANFATKAVAAGLAERQVRLAEAQGAVLGQGLRWLVEQMTGRLDLDAAQQTTVRELVADMFRQLSAGTAPQTIEGNTA